MQHTSGYSAPQLTEKGVGRKQQNLHSPLRHKT